MKEIDELDFIENNEELRVIPNYPGYITRQRKKNTCCDLLSNNDL
ncbi:hypothetical protein [Sporocytophaga myxococcoides]|nr:hypothetical protein [Sporocytophaga myxococcoides]